MAMTIKQHVWTHVEDKTNERRLSKCCSCADAPTAHCVQNNLKTKKSSSQCLRPENHSRPLEEPTTEAQRKPPAREPLASSSSSCLHPQTEGTCANPPEPLPWLDVERNGLEGPTRKAAAAPISSRPVSSSRRIGSKRCPKDLAHHDETGSASRAVSGPCHSFASRNRGA